MRVVNAANSSLLGGGGVDGQSTGRQGRSCWRSAGCSAAARRDEAKITKAYNLPCKYVIHGGAGVGNGGENGGAGAFGRLLPEQPAAGGEERRPPDRIPSISTGIFHFPVDMAAEIAGERGGPLLKKEHDRGPGTDPVVLLTRGPS